MSCFVSGAYYTLLSSTGSSHFLHPFIHSILFFFFVPSDFGWMINSLNEIAESKEKATTRYPTEQKTSTNMPALIDPIEQALRKGKTWEISDWTSFSQTHTNKHTETMKKRHRYGVIQINSMTFQCVCIYTKSHGWEIWTAISHLTKGGNILKKKRVNSGVLDSGISKNDQSSVCVEMSLKCTNTEIFMWLPSWNDAPITKSYSK